jgi:hypothetical protein
MVEINLNHKETSRETRAHNGTVKALKNLSKKRVRLSYTLRKIRLSFF